MTRGPPKRGAPSTFCLNISKEFEGHTNWDILTSSHKRTYMCKGKSFCFFRTRWEGVYSLFKTPPSSQMGLLEAENSSWKRYSRIHHQGEWKWFLPFLLHNLSKSMSTLDGFSRWASGLKRSSQLLDGSFSESVVAVAGFDTHAVFPVGLWRLVLAFHSFILYTYTIYPHLFDRWLYTLCYTLIDVPEDVGTMVAQYLS